MKKHKKSLPCWENREEDLSKVKRYHTFKVMFYRTDLLLHSERVQEIVKVLLPVAKNVYPKINSSKTILISKFHDDHEMVSKRGDISLQLKLQLTEKGDENELLSIHQEEIMAIDFLSKCYKNPRISNSQYRDLLIHSALKDCPEAQLHSFADKIDGYCEAIHEVLAGNIGFLEPVINYIAKTFNDLPGKYPLIRDLFAIENTLFFFPVVDLHNYTNFARIGASPHTLRSMVRRTKIPHYELWKEITLSFPNGEKLLTEQKEFHPNSAT